MDTRMVATSEPPKMKDDPGILCLVLSLYIILYIVYTPVARITIIHCYYILNIIINIM